MFNFCTKKPAVGIDISDHSIEVLQLNKRREVLAYSRTILEEGLIENGKILNKDKLVEKLKEALGNTKPTSLYGTNKKIRVILSLPESRVFTHYFELTAKEIEKVSLGQVSYLKLIEEATKKVIPFESEKIYWDYFGLEKDRNSLPKIIFYVAAPKEIVDDYVQITERAGMELEALDIESISIGRALLKRAFINKTSMIIDIGARTTNIGIFEGGFVPGLSVTVPLAGSNFTREIAEKLKVKEVDAEKLKGVYGFDDLKSNNRVLPILESAIQKIIKEIKSSISYYEKGKNKTIEEIILTGGSALIPKIDEYLGLNIKRKVTISNPLDKIQKREELSKAIPAVFFSNVVGLALRGVSPKEEGIDLLRRLSAQGSQHQKVSRLLALIKSGLPASVRRYALITLFTFVALTILGFVVYTYIFQAKYQNRTLSPSGESTREPEKESLPGEMQVNKETLPAETKNEKVEETKGVTVQNTPTGWLNVREGPGINYALVTKIDPGKSYILLDEKEQWYKIKVDEKTEGWITSQYAIKSFR